ncbi:GGDEF domain-containing protein [Tolumonas lignilytica]|uniref:GGDEF domain-containing protein n=1 Tax=Tolumonas lignilytica TaxID=1283284 RepID=UPI0004641C94|nr:GGDEF domain-containing protein [Tolumonas lignilytica]
MVGLRWIALLFAFVFIHPTVAAERVVVQLKWVNQFQFAGYYAALEKGYYKAAGLDVVLRPNGYNGSFVSPVDAVVSGNAQYGISNSGLVLDYLNGKPVVVLAATLQHSAVTWIVLEKSGIRTIHDMVKKRLMTVFPLSESLELLEPFRAEGISPQKLNLVQTGFDLQPLIDGKVDAYDGYVTNEPFLLEQKGIPYRLIDPRTYGIDFYGDVLFTSQSELRKHPERVAAFRKASMDGWRYAMAHPEEIIDLIMRKYAPQKTREHLRFEAKAMWSLMQPDIIEIGHMNPGRWLRIAEVMTEHNRLIDDKMLSPFIYNAEDYQPVLVRYFRIATLASIIALLLAAIATWVYRINRRLTREIEARQAAEEQLRHLSETDPLTGLANRRVFDQYLQQEFQRFLRYHHPFSVVMVDIDWFKRINDSYGHPAGDHVLNEFAWRLRDHIRQTDFLARIGGEEFAILMPETYPLEAKKRTEHLQRIIAERPFQLPEVQNPLGITASFGISCVTENDLNAEASLGRADHALYKAKNSGRNKVELFNASGKLTLVTDCPD